MGGGELHQQLKNLCLNTNWKYAVFWKLDNRSRMVLTLEDAYYCDGKEKNNNSFDNMNEHGKDDQHTQDHLLLAVANMRYQVYPIGEGIVGKVAATGKHLWITGDQLGNTSCSMQTVVAVAIVPYGVVQLGASHTIVEDLKLVNSIKEIFYDLQSSLMTSTPCSPCVTSISSGSVRVHKYVNNQDRTMENNSLVTKKMNNRKEKEHPMSDFMQSALCNDQNQFETKINESYEFPGGCELYEALGPAFRKQERNFEWEMMSAETQTVTEIPQETSSSCLVTQISASEKGSKSMKVGKKRGRPGESCRRGPKDRQLIEDRIKELRQLVPNGSKCSIETLLQRTIKHMLFMQRMMKHADKLDHCAEFKSPGKETGIHRPASQDQGSSWAIEVGSDKTMCPLIVENIGNGQMLVEMMSDRCVLEITEAIRRLGLTILKSATDARGDKTWMCFVVEGENNVNVHRMDILWSLLKTMESKT